MEEKSIIHFETLGCKLNQIESESIARAFRDAGFCSEMTPYTAKTNQNADVSLCIVNTCTVTAKAEQKARRLIRLLLEKCPAAVVLVTGCYAEVEPVAIRSLDPRIAVLRGTQKDVLADLPKALERAVFESGKTKAGKWPFESGKTDGARALEQLLEELLDARRASPEEALKHSSFALCTDTFMQHSRASLKIQDGCNNNCAYCRIHIARGPAVSLSASDVLERVRLLEAAGQKEVVLTGVNLSQYAGSTQNLKNDEILNLSGAQKNGILRPYIDFAQLLKLLLDNTKTINFRISSLYPDRIDDEMCEAIKDERIRPHFHLSVQSGSNAVLHAMNRPYNAEDVVKAARRLRELKPGCFLACDVITGFPGETEEDFEQTLAMCREADFSWIHVFPFSARPGTAAYKMRPQVPQSISGDRAARLTAFACAQKKAYLETFIGKEVTAIVEKRRTDELRAVTENFIHVRLHPLSDAASDSAHLGGKEVKILIEKVFESRSQTEDVEAEGKIL
ncbi:MAG: tRNA (N(6)-L-threonylcarbamoyladenosine(37)-C(2))-methylthiotransferase MtaB [Treponema sp.]|nr:tRNA (N(6)-L-threonylcarbamoyladenosine(37)-C(2))-methylthiotransferase MtaB [Candidatus Treponema caballi]